MIALLSEKNMKNTTSIFLLIVLLLCDTADAAVIFGSHDCGQWLNRQRGRAHSETWVLGYLSGLNVAHDQAGFGPRDPLDFLNSPDQAFAWLDNFCQANPLRKLDGAANELFKELKVRKQ